MLSRTLFLCLLAAVFSTGFSLSCQWTARKFGECSKDYLKQLEAMATNTTEDAEMDHVTFPNDLYSLAFKASAEDKVGFTVQVLEEVLDLFKEDHSSASWEQITVENFLSVIDRQAHELSSCIRNRTTEPKLHEHFTSLSHFLQQNSHSAESWELIRKKIKRHLQKVDRLVSSVLPANN